MKDLMMLYGVTLGRRYTLKQKRYFFGEISETYPMLGFPVKLQENKLRSMSLGNIVAGDINKADTVFVAAYDTPTRSILPNLKYYPFHTDKNLRAERWNLAVQILFSLLFTAASFFSLRAFLYNHNGYRGAFLAMAIISAFGILYFTKAKQNLVNFNRNSASLAVMAKIAEDCKGNTKAAFIFLDQGVSSFHGLRLLQRDYGNQGKSFVALDCIACGEKLVLAHRSVDNQAAKRFIDIVQNNGMEIADKVYSEEKAVNNILSFDEHFLYLVSGSIENKEFVVKNTRSKKDTKVNIPRLNAITQAMIEYFTIDDERRG